MQKAAMTAIAVQTSPDDIKHLKELFLAIDKNGDGSLTFQEIEQGLKDLNIANREQLLINMREADTDGSGELDYTEFIAACLDEKLYLNEKYLKAAFDMFDKDGSGMIDNDEVIELLQGDQLDGIISKSAIKEAMKEIDKNGDGEIDFEEFKLMMKMC
jgi:calcium-dependent protein kinase